MIKVSNSPIPEHKRSYYPFKDLIEPGYHFFVPTKNPTQKQHSLTSCINNFKKRYQPEWKFRMRSGVNDDGVRGVYVERIK